jgi:hypothetical protein
MHDWWLLVRDYEQRFDVSEAMIHVAMGSLLLRRSSHCPISTDSNPAIRHAVYLSLDIVYTVKPNRSRLSRYRPS